MSDNIQTQEKSNGDLVGFAGPFGIRIGMSGHCAEGKFYEPVDVYRGISFPVC